MQLVVGIFLLALFIIRLYRWSKDTELHKYFWLGLSLKILAGWFLGSLYFNYYGVGDTINFYEDGSLLRKLAFDEPGKYLSYLLNDQVPGPISSLLHYDISSPRAWFFDKLLSLFMIALGSNYWVLSAFCSTVAFSGMMFFSLQVKRRFRVSDLTLLAGVYILPSVVLWSSGVTKESIALACLMFMIGIALSASRSIRFNWWKQVPAFIIAFWICWELKYYYAGLALPALAAPMVAENIKRYRIATWLAVWTLSILAVSSVQVNLAPDFLPEVIYNNNKAFIEKSDPGDYIIFNDLGPDWPSILKNVPMALWSGLFRPFLADLNGIFKWGSGLESLGLLVLLLFQWPKLKSVFHNNDNTWFFSAVAYIFILATFLALSTPNFGTLVRYKAGFYFLFTCLILWDHPIFAWIKKRRDG